MITGVKSRRFRIQIACLLGSVFFLILLAGCTEGKPPIPGEETGGKAEEKVPAGATVLTGAGATFPSVLYHRWFTVYHDSHPDTYIKYAAVGSGEGVRRFVGKNISDGEQVDFGASDAAMSDAQIADANNDVLMVPATAGCARRRKP